MPQLFETAVTQTDLAGKVTVLVPIASYVAKDANDAKQTTLIENASVLRDADNTVKEGIDVSVRPFC